MSGTELIPLGTSIVSDVMSALLLPGGATLAHAAEKYVARKRREAAEILIEEVSGGYHGKIQFEDHDVEPLIGIIYRFSKAAEDGAARENLRLLAQIIAGLKKNKALNADKFRRWCGVLEQLTRDELLLIGKGYIIQKAIEAAGPDAPNDFWQQLDAAMQEGRYEANEVVAIASSVSRTGLLTPVSAWGGVVYMPSPWLDELGQLANLESVGNATTT